MNNELTSCSICGAEHDPKTAPEIDSTHLCPDCASAQTALRRPEQKRPSATNRRVLAVRAA